MREDMQIGFQLARGVIRHLRQYNFQAMAEFVPQTGLRVDVIAIGPKGEIWIIECKSSRSDFQTDQKWQGYLEWCDQFFFAVPQDFPVDILPADQGLILADAYDAEIIRPAPMDALSAPRRKKVTLKFARNAADRLQQEREARL